MQRERRAGRLNEPSSDLGLYVLCGLGGMILLAVLVGWTSAGIAGLSPGGNPLGWVVDLATGEAAWSVTATLIALITVVCVVCVVCVVGRAVLTPKAGASRVDHLAASMSKPSDFQSLTMAALRGDAGRLGVAAECGAGVPVGKAVNGGTDLGTSWEWTQLWIMGPRAGKTSSLCIPQVLATGGPVLATSNKRDLLDATRGPRSQIGLVRVHDPQSLAGTDEPSWWWSPLSYVIDVTRADQVASLFTAAVRDADAKPDAYFDPAGRTLVSALLLAGAKGSKTMADVFNWVRTPDDREPEDLLLEAGEESSALDIESFRSKTAKQRDGIYGTAETMLSWLRNPRVQAWITPGEGRVEFKPEEFVRSKDTLYLLSKEGPGSARALTATLTVAVTQAAEELSIEQGGRLRRPLLCMLDEVANICRWPELPDLYSHYGSRGIILASYLQSWSQGVRVFGRPGMKQLWDAANLRGVGMGIADDEFAGTISRLVGDHDKRTRSTSQSMRSGSSTSQQLRREKILDVDDVSSLPQGRAVVFASGVPAVLLALQHWGTLPQAELIRASVKHYGEGSEAA